LDENGEKFEIKEVKTIQGPVQSRLAENGNLEVIIPIGYQGTTKIELKFNEETEPLVIEIPIVGPKLPIVPKIDAIDKPRFVAPVDGKVNVLGLDGKVSVSWKIDKDAAAYEVKSGEETVCLTVYASCQLPSTNNQTRAFTVQAIRNDGAKSEIATGQGAALPSGTLLAIVYFKTDQSRLTKQSTATLSKLVNDLQALGLRDVSLAGHTDTRQSLSYNQRLSTNRSSSVQRWLGKTVVDAVIAKNQFGETKLAVDETIIVGNQSNRRVEIRVA
jgi:outer membrane protein OmpA-like peptidoglycan-associated protein